MNFNVLRCRCHRGNVKQNNRNIVLSSNAYKGLPPEEQHRANRDLLGIEEPIDEETPGFIQGKLEELDSALGLLGDSGATENYDLALAMEQRQQSGGEQEPYVGSAKFRLTFLRAERFDARLAAKRLAAYFSEKRDLFGDEKLARKIKQNDLTGDEREALVSGVLTYTGTSDAAGRPVIVVCRSNIQPSWTSRCLKRVFFYVFQVAIEDNETAQKSGLAFVAYNMRGGCISPSQPTPEPPQFALRSVMPARKLALRALPFRVAACHYCYEDLREHIVINLISFATPEIYKARFMAHYQKTHEECMMKLGPYGIHSDSLPLTEEGDFHFEKIQTYWEKQRRLEE